MQEQEQIDKKESINEKIPLFSKEIKCKYHPDYNIEKLCLEKNCNIQHSWICIECLSTNDHPHKGHFEQLVGIQQLSKIRKGIEQNPVLGYSKLKDAILCSKQHMKLQIQDSLQKIEQRIQKELKIFQNNLFTKYQKQLEYNQEEELNNLEELETILMPISQIQEQAKEFEENPQESYQQSAQKIKDLFYNFDNQEKISKLQQKSSEKQEIVKILDQTLEYLNKLSDQIAEEIQNFNTQVMSINLEDRIKLSQYFSNNPNNFKIKNFIPCEFTSSQLKIDFTQFQETGLIKMLSNTTDNRIYSEPFNQTESVIFKLILPNIRSKTSGCFYIGISEASLQEQPSWGNFGGGNWYCLDVKGSYKQTIDSIKDNGKNNDTSLHFGDVFSTLPNNSEFVVLINASKSIFTIFNFKSGCVIQNKLEMNFKEKQDSKIVFHISDLYGKDVIFKHKISEDEQNFIIKHGLQNQVIQSTNYNHLEYPQHASDMSFNDSF